LGESAGIAWPLKGVHALIFELVRAYPSRPWFGQNPGFLGLY